MPTINGQAVARAIIARLKKKPRPEKFFGVFLIGADQASLSFIKQKEKIAEELGIDFRLYHFSETITQDELRREVLKIALHKTCGGVVVQLPLPQHINRQYVLNVIPPVKDVDVLGERSLGAFYAGRSTVLAPAVGVVDEIGKIIQTEWLKVKVAVVGRGPLIGRPIALGLMDQAAELTVFHSQGGGSVSEKLNNFDVVISGVGTAGLFGAAHLKPGAIVIDFGYGERAGRPRGDFDPAGAEAKNIRYTPTPGGTGPILVAKLFENFYKLNQPIG